MTHCGRGRVSMCSVPTHSYATVGVFHSHWFEWRIFNRNVRNVLDSYVKSGQYFCTNNISLETSVHWPSEETGRLEIEVEVYEQFVKM